MEGLVVIQSTVVVIQTRTVAVQVVMVDDRVNRISWWLHPLLGFPDSSVAKESSCNAGDPGLILRLGRSRWRKDRLPTPVFLGFPCGSAGKESACSAGDLGSIPMLGRSPGEQKGYTLQYSGLENSMESQTQLSDFHQDIEYKRKQEEFRILPSFQS